jgi:ABC-type branched-subunit amino acid transport system substrate-binding protein
MSCKLITHKIFITFLVIFFICYGKAVTAVENPSVTGITIQEKEGAPEITAPHTQMKQQQVKQEDKTSAFSFAVGAPDLNAIGCVLPLSGRYGDNGNKALDAILLATGMFDEKNRTSWKIVAADSRGLPEGGPAAVAHLAKTQNVIAIITVAGATEAMEMAREADRWKIPIILITAKEGVTSSNQYAFQHFLTPSQQIGALTKYALDNLNCAIFSILYPKDDYGIEMVKTIRAQATQIGGKVERAIPYSKTQTDFSEEIYKLSGYGIDAAKKIPANKVETKVRVSVDFEALFIPDSYQRVRMITSQLAFYDVKGFRLLGTSLWNSPDLLKKGAEYLEGAVFADSFFVNSFYPETNDFVDIYYTIYSREPENIEALAYDTAKMIISVLKDKNIQTREQFIAGLQQLENYRGATGNTSFSGGRVATKTAFILQVKNGKLEQVK